MALITVENVVVLDNPTKFTNPFQFEITFSCHAPGIPHELEWKLTYVGSADNERLDQELDAVLVGPIAVGKNKFVFQAPPPDAEKIPQQDLLEVTVILLTCSYLDQEFIRVGYYVNNDYGPNVQLMEQHLALKDARQPFTVAVDQLHRNILADKPRVTRFQIHWSEEEKKAAQNQSTVEGLPVLNAAHPEYQGGKDENMDDDMEQEDYLSDYDEGDEGDEAFSDDKENMQENMQEALYPSSHQPVQLGAPKVGAESFQQGHSMRMQAAGSGASESMMDEVL